MNTKQNREKVYLSVSVLQTHKDRLGRQTDIETTKDGSRGRVKIERRDTS